MKRRVSYFFDSKVPSHYYGPGHPMKPFRLQLTHHLLLAYGLYDHMDVIRPGVASRNELVQFHSPEFVDFLAAASPHNRSMNSSHMAKFGCGQQTDCPVSL